MGCPMPLTPQMPVVPMLETERLILRGHRLEDFDDSFALWSDPKVTRYTGNKPASREEVWNRLLRYVGHWALLGYGFWNVRERGSDRFVGEVKDDFHCSPPVRPRRCRGLES